MLVYLDHNATTPLDERVLESMLPFLGASPGNPSSVHAAGRTARTAVEVAREQVAALVAAHPDEVVFTAGGTEANNTALKGVAWRRPGRLAISAIEHPSVSVPAAALGRLGWDVESIGVDTQGRVNEAALDEALRRGADLVSLMWANNETGVVQPMKRLAGLVRERGALLHSDAVQAAGKIPLRFGAEGEQLMSLSAHKIGGPKGAGALLVDRRVELGPLLHGGGQERNRRGGTENVPAIVGFGKAAELALAELRARRTHWSALRDGFEARLRAAVPEVVVFGSEAERLPNTMFFAVPGIDGATLVLALDRRGVAVSSGSACGSRHEAPSSVLTAMGVAPELARCAVRVSIGTSNGEADIEVAVKAIAAEVGMLRRMATPQWA